MMEFVNIFNERVDKMLKIIGIERKTKANYLFFSFLVAFLILSATFPKLPFLSIALFIIVFLVLVFAGYYYCYIEVESKRRGMEEKLPYFLHLLSSKIKLGMGFSKALKESAKPEFGDLSKEINKASNLKEVNEAFDSHLLEKTFLTLSTAVQSGRDVSEVAEHRARDIAEAMDFEAQIRNVTRTNLIFLYLLTLLIVPATIIFSRSSFILNTSILLLLIFSFLSSVFIGALRERNKILGLKHFPILVLGSIAIFFLLKLRL